MAKRKPRWYFNFRSPYSWLAHHDLTERYPDVAGMIDWIPYWDPDERTLSLLDDKGAQFLYKPMAKDKHLYILADVRRLAADRGLTVSWPVDRSPAWEVAHLPYLIADAHGVGRDYVGRVHQARFEQGLDVTDPAVIETICGELGLDRTLVRDVLSDNELRARAVDELLSAYKDGVFGPPFFVNGREKFWGVDRLARFAASVRGTLPTAPPGPDLTLPAEAGSVADAGHAGGCG
jgi:2-hydroxychromene-2-carboxylate isomerase